MLLFCPEALKTRLFPFHVPEVLIGSVHAGLLDGAAKPAQAVSKISLLPFGNLQTIDVLPQGRIQDKWATRLGGSEVGGGVQTFAGDKLKTEVAWENMF